MTDTEKRELDAWIAERVMGWKLDKMIWWSRNDIDKTQSIAWEGDFRPTTDPAATMEVLKRCAEKLEVINSSIALGQQFDELVEDRLFWFVSHERTKEVTEAETLELAICLFAKKLFTK